jgi:small nuclear ribonucleoprotein B and B'
MPGSQGKSSKLLLLIDSRLRVTISDRRVLIGTFLAFDKFMNIVLADCEEFRTSTVVNNSTATEATQRRALGLIILRGENVVSISVEGPPPATANKKVAPGGPGAVRAMGRGAPVPAMSAPAGLGAGAVYGVGGGVGGGMGRGMPPQY